MSGLLDGMRVLDASIWRPVPHATQMLADLGADVCKLEPPGGDPMRAFPELFRDLASHKHSVVVDLRTPEGRERALELARRADVFCEGWRPGVAQRLGVSYDDVRRVNPTIVYCSISGYGQAGPLVDRAGHDVNYQALAGAVAPRHDRDPEPTIPRVPIADLAAGSVAAMLICAAWARRLHTGEGEHIDVAMADVCAAWVGPHARLTPRGATGPAGGSAGYGVFRCADDGFVTLAVISEDHLWRAVCTALGLDDLAELTYLERLPRVEECNGAIAAVLSTMARDDAVARLAAAGAPVAPALTAKEMATHEQFVTRGVVRTDGDGQLRVGFPAVLGQHPPRSPGRVPEVGEHGPEWA